MQVSQSNENISLTSLHISYICSAVKPLLIFAISSSDMSSSDMSSRDVAMSSESLSTRLTKTGKN